MNKVEFNLMEKDERAALLTTLKNIVTNPHFSDEIKVIPLQEFEKYFPSEYSVYRQQETDALATAKLLKQAKGA